MEKRVPTRTIGRGFENASGLGSWTNHPMHLAHMVDHQSHVRTEPSEVRARRARAQNRHETTDSQMVFVGTVFPPYYKCSWEIEQDNWPGCRREIEPDNWSVVRLDFPSAFVVRCKNAFPRNEDYGWGSGYVTNHFGARGSTGCYISVPVPENTFYIEEHTDNLFRMCSQAGTLEGNISVPCSGPGGFILFSN
jgi:hypothetical protein